MLLTSLTDAEFLRHAQAQHDQLVASATETELLRRFEILLDQSDASESVRDLLAEHDIDIFAKGGIDDLRNSLAFHGAALAHDLDTAEALTKQLDRISKFDDLMNDLTEPLKTLAELAPN